MWALCGVYLHFGIIICYNINTHPNSSHNKSEYFKSVFQKRVDENSACTFGAKYISHYLGFRIDFLVAIFIIICASFYVFERDTTNPGLMALSLQLVTELANSLQFLFIITVEIENQMTSVERSLEYTKIVSEQNQAIDNTHRIQGGSVKFNNVSMKYGDSEAGKIILKKINFGIEDGMKLGIVGRTGSGKSSLLVVY